MTTLGVHLVGERAALEAATSGSQRIDARSVYKKRDAFRNEDTMQATRKQQVARSEAREVERTTEAELPERRVQP